MSNNCAFLIMSCDNRSNIISQFTNLLKITWKDNLFNKYICVEKDEISIDGYKTLNISNNYFSNRLIKALNTINEDYVFLLLEDHWPYKNIDDIKINHFLEIMKSNSNIANIAFSIMDGPGEDKTNYYSDLVKRKKRSYSLVNFQPGLWNKKLLLTLLKENEDPWYSEIFSSLRVRLHKDYLFYCMKAIDVNPYVSGNGWLIVRSKWNIDEVKKIEEIYNIKVDLGNMPTDSFKGNIKLSFWTRVKFKIRIYSYKFKLFMTRRP